MRYYIEGTFIKGHFKDDKVFVPFMEGNFVFAKNEGTSISLFDRMRVVTVPPMVRKTIRFASWLRAKDTASAEINYQLKKAGRPLGISVLIH